MDNQGSFTVTATITFYPFRVPPRCRKPRRVAETFTRDINIPSITGTEAPIAAWLPTDRFGLHAPGGGDAPLRTWSGQLLSPVAASHDKDAPVAMAGTDTFPAENDFDVHAADTEAEAADLIGKSFESIVVIDGEVWKHASEPIYAIHQLGMGHNHGGTLLSIESSARGSSRVFSLLEPEVAIEAALNAAADRGNDQSYEGIRNTVRPIIVEPSAFTFPLLEDRLREASTDIHRLVSSAAVSLDAGLDTGLDRDGLDAAINLLNHAKDIMVENSMDEAAPSGESRPA